MRAAFDNCSIAKYSRAVEITQFNPEVRERTTQTFTEYAEIRGPWIGGCRIFVKWNNAEGSLANWKGAEMSCIIDTKNYNLTYDGLKKTCEGRLIEAHSPNAWTPDMTGMKTPLN